MIAVPTPTYKNVVVRICVDCNRNTRFIAFYRPYYGWTGICLKCGTHYEDNRPLPLKNPGQHNIDEAKKLYRSLPPRAKNHLGKK